MDAKEPNKASSTKGRSGYGEVSLSQSRKAEGGNMNETGGLQLGMSSVEGKPNVRTLDKAIYGLSQKILVAPPEYTAIEMKSWE